MCSGGTVAPGTYAQMTITGVCSMPDGNVTVLGDLTVAPGALLDDGAPGDPTASPTVAATLDVHGNVTVGSGAVLILGCSPNSACTNPPAISSSYIWGNLTATNALGVLVHSSVVGHNLTIDGGGGGTMGGVTTDACFAASPPAPWSQDPALDFIPVYSDVEDSSVGGNLTISNLSSCWLGTLRNHIGGNATFVNDQMGDVDAMEIGNNVVNHNLACSGDDPAPQFGEGAAPDIVGGMGSGQCGFDVVLQNPAAQALGGSGTGISEHFVVSTRNLHRYQGTFSGTADGPSLYQLSTEAGNTLTAQILDFALGGAGVNGTGTYSGGPPGQSPGEAALVTSYPSPSGPPGPPGPQWLPSEPPLPSVPVGPPGPPGPPTGPPGPPGSRSIAATFTTYDVCAPCAFASQSGTVSFRSYGTTDRSGFTTGWFVITSSGTVLPTPDSTPPGLATLVGYGTFSGSGDTAQVSEVLGFG